MERFGRLFSLSGLSLDRLRTFLAVVEAGSIARAAKDDPVRQSQFSRQIKELEACFGVALTRRVGRRIEITAEGHRLAEVIRRQFGELDDFREAMNNRPVSVRIGAQGSLIEWLLLPAMKECRAVLGGATLEIEQHRSADIVTGVSDGRLDFGLVRSDAVTSGVRQWKLGKLRYAFFAPPGLWRSGATVESILRTQEIAGLFPGRQFHSKLEGWLEEQNFTPNIVARLGSFVQLARLAKLSGLPCVLPVIAAVDFDPRRMVGMALPWKHEREVVLIANQRSLDRSGIPPAASTGLREVLSRGLTATATS